MVDETQRYLAAEMERMMKVQDVLLKALAKKITWWATAEIIGVKDRTMLSWREGLEKNGHAGLAYRRKGKASKRHKLGPHRRRGPRRPLPGCFSTLTAASPAGLRMIEGMTRWGFWAM